MIFHHPGAYPHRPLADHQDSRLYQPTTPPALDYRRGVQIWYLGPGLYFQQPDGLWLRSTCRLAAPHQTTEVWNSCPPGAINVETLILNQLTAFGLPADKTAFPATEAQCRVLAALAERWHMPWCWLVTRQKRRWQSDLFFASFAWNYRKVCTP